MSEDVGKQQRTILNLWARPVGERPPSRPVTARTLHQRFYPHSYRCLSAFILRIGSLPSISEKFSERPFESEMQSFSEKADLVLRIVFLLKWKMQMYVKIFFFFFGQLYYRFDRDYWSITDSIKFLWIVGKRVGKKNGINEKSYEIKRSGLPAGFVNLSGRKALEPRSPVFCGTGCWASFVISSV